MNRKQEFFKVIADILITVFIAFLISLPFRFYIAEAYIVSGASMEPTFYNQDFIVAEKITKKYDDINQGDIVLFHYNQISIIKRVIATPNDEIIIKKNGQVFVNGKLINEPYLKEKRTIINKEINLKLASDEYFVLGDNRNNSKDSRHLGPIKKKFLIGKPIGRLYPFDRLNYRPGKYDYK